MLFTSNLEITAGESKHAAIDGGDAGLELLERETG